MRLEFLFNWPSTPPDDVCTRSDTPPAAVWAGFSFGNWDRISGFRARPRGACCWRRLRRQQPPLPSIVMPGMCRAMNFERQEFACVEEGKRQMELPCLNGHAFWVICRRGMKESGKSKSFLVTFRFGVRIIDPFISQEVEAFEA